MLDVHAPHESVHTWKDFFIHIATIVIGLLIAIGLEQTVEFFHHRHQVAEAREQPTLILYARMFNLQWNLHKQFPQFSPGPDPSDWRKIVRVVSPERDRTEADVLRDNLREEIERIQAQDKHR
jgi:hypothetical protein